MNSFKNIINDPDAAVILIYGELNDNWEKAVSASDVVRDLMRAELDGKRVDVRINSVGGTVSTGIAIFNALRNTKAEVTIYIDGVAASMASAVATARKPVYMSKYARLMIHSVQGGAWGDANNLKTIATEIEALEQTLISLYAERTGKSSEEIKAEWFDGKDHWFGAQQALDLGLIDGIYDVAPVSEDINTPEKLYSEFINRLNEATNISTSMDFLNELRKRPSFANIADENAVLQQIATIEANAAKVPELNKQVTELTAKLSGYETAEKARNEKEITDLVNQAATESRIKAAEVPVFVALLNADRANGEAALKARTPMKMVIDELGNPQPQNAASPWDKRQAELRKANGYE